MIVVDASAAVLGLLTKGEARRRMAREAVAVPHLIDAEITHALRGQVLRGTISPSDGARTLRTWAHLGVQRYPLSGLLDRMWSLRDNLSAYDAGYVALAEALGCDLVTADARLGLAPGPSCAVTVLRD